jgi:hypothetical protein
MSADPSHKLTSGPRFVGRVLSELARSDEGRGYLEWARRGGGDFSAEDRVAIREFLQARRKSPPPAESAPASRVPQLRNPSVGTKRRP